MPSQIHDLEGRAKPSETIPTYLPCLMSFRRAGTELSTRWLSTRLDHYRTVIHHTHDLNSRTHSSPLSRQSRPCTSVLVEPHRLDFHQWQSADVEPITYTHQKAIWVVRTSPLLSRRGDDCTSVLVEPIDAAVLQPMASADVEQLYEKKKRFEQSDHSSPYPCDVQVLSSNPFVHQHYPNECCE